MSVSQTELGSLISTAENLKIKGLAEPERPLEKSVKRLASPPRGVTGPHSTGVVTGSLQHAPLTLFQGSSPSAKRKRGIDSYGIHCGYSTKEEKGPTNPDGAPSQVVLLPSTPSDLSSTTGAPTDLAPPQAGTYVSHHPSISNSEGVLYSVAGSAIYVGTSQGGNTGVSRGGEIVREVYPPPPPSVAPSSESYMNNENGEDTAPGPSGIQNENSSMVSLLFLLFISLRYLKI